MEIIKERTRIIFSDYNTSEKNAIEDMVATMDKVFTYEDPDKCMICLPTGMENATKRLFPRHNIIDKSKEYWPYNNMENYEINVSPRNQLQKDFISFMLDNMNKKQKSAGILSVGTGKFEPNFRKIPTPDQSRVRGYIRMGDIKVGDYVFGSDGKPTEVIGVFPQGKQDIYKITFNDGRTALCGLEHLWNVRTDIEKPYQTISTKEMIHLMRDHNKIEIPSSPLGEFKGKRVFIENIIDANLNEESTCIMVANEDGLYCTEDYIVTHNTFMACYCATKFRAKTLIIVPTSAIKFQWADTLTGMFKIPKNRVVTINTPTQFINVNADFVIVSQATLASLNKSYDLEKIMKDNRFGFKVIDEVQMWFHNIIKVDGCSNIANNLYLTGTFGRSGEDENRLYQEMFGDISIFREKEKKPTLFDRKPGNIYGMKPHTNFKMYWANSRLPNDLMKKVTSAWKYSDRSDKWTRIGINMAAYVKIVFPDDGRNTPLLQALFKIIQIALNEINYGKTLILMPSIASAEMVANYMRQRYPNLKTGTLHSKNPKSVNAENKKNCDCLVSTVPSAGTGFDWKGLSRLINATPYKSWIIATQVRGRLRILDSGKDTYMYELVDARIPQLRRWANVRSQVYRKECKTFKVIDMK